MQPNEYDPSFEWPGAEEYSQALTPDDVTDEPVGTTSTSFFRLVALKSSVLSLAKHRLAILTGYSEVQLGRDKPVSDTVVPRIRLREMAVSKIHATTYWDGPKREWALVDMGSMHGTFWEPAGSPEQRPESSSSSATCSASTSTGATPSGTRLSPPRVASMPQTLRHLDRVTIGSTTFEVHIHEDDLACEVCASGANEIPLFHNSGSQKTSSRAYESRTDLRPAGQAPIHAKKSLAMLKSSLLQQHGHSRSSRESSPSGSKYTDRAEQRRRMYGSLPPASGPSIPPPRSQRVQPVEHFTPPPPRPQVVSDPPQRIAESNVGHGLLTRMGWEPGTTLGLSSTDGDDGSNDESGSHHLLEPIQPKHTTNRAGLGAALHVAHSEPTSNGNWREGPKRRRYEALQSSVGRNGG